MRPALILAALALAALTGCLEEASEPAGERLSDAERTDCLMRGGTVGHGGISRDEVCFRPQPDAGKSCSRAGDCDGPCLAETRTCARVTPVLGCYRFLDQQGRVSDICVH